MYKKFGNLFIITTAIFVFISAWVFSAETKKKKHVTNPVAIQKTNIFINDEYPVKNINIVKKSLTSDKTSRTSISPGTVVGDTWYDLQHLGSMGRMIDLGPHSGEMGSPMTHFSWMNLLGPVFYDRKYSYNYYDASNGAFGSMTGLQPDDEYAGYVGLDVTPDGRAVVGGQNNQGAGFQPQIYFDVAPGAEFFMYNTRIPDTTAEYGQLPGTAMMWPKFRYQYGTDTVLHVIAQGLLGTEEYDTTSSHAITYFRKVGNNDSGQWDYPPFVIDTVFNPSHDIAALRNSDKVALVWAANLPNLGDCDTCSATGNQFPQWDNDIYYQISYDQGLTWQPRVNITQNVDGVTGFRPYADLSALIDSYDVLHILYSAVHWPAEPDLEGWDTRCRLFHWSENVPYTRTVAVADWSQTQCKPGRWNLNISKMSISECDSKLYALWVQYNDPPMGINDDCSINGFANGDLYVSISFDGGLTWDPARNLTNTFTPGCDPLVGDSCANDNWPSMARYGRQNQFSEDWSGAEEVVPGNVSWGGDYYLDVQYIDDKDAGAVVLGEGSWQLNDVKWFRMACVEPVPTPCLYPSFTSIEYPAWGHPYMQTDTFLTLENPCNITLSYNITVEEDIGPSGWLAVYGFSGTIPAGANNSETGIISLNYGGMVGGPTQLIGRLIINSNAPSSPDTIPIEFLVVDTLLSPVIDTLTTSCLSLVVTNSGNFGNRGAGRVNMDWVNAGDCDTMADVYLYDGSPVIGWINGADTVMNWSIYGANYLDPNGFVPVEPGAGSWSPDASMNIFETAIFTTHDSSIAMQKLWYTPQDIDSCDFIIQALKIWSYDGLYHYGLVIGEAIDWDIPSDTGVDNIGGFDLTRNLIYLQGVEYNQDDTIECQNNDTRFGGMAFIESYLNDSQYQTFPYSGFVTDNQTYVYPNSGFVPSELYENMQFSGYWLGDSVNQDLHSVICYEPNFVLGATDTFVVYTILSTVMNGAEFDLQARIDKGKEWYNNHLPQSPSYTCGDVNNDGGIDLIDVIYFTDFLFSFGPPPPVMEAADMDWFTDINISDLVYLINYLFSYGPAPCEGPPKSNMPVTGGIVSLDHVDGLYNSLYVIKAGEPITFYIRINNDIPGKSIPIPGITNGFRIYSPTGANWGTTISDTTDNFDSSPFDGGFFINNYSLTGSGADTVGFGGFSLNDVGLQAGYNNIAYQITIGPIDPAYDGDTVCLDSSWFPPVNEWLWATGYEQYFSDWNGPHCFEVARVSYLKANFNSNLTAGAAPLTVDFTDLSTGNPETWYWDFGDGGTSNAQNPSHQYNDPGMYDVTLTVSDSIADVDTSLKLGYIKVGENEYTDLVAMTSLNPWGNRPGFEMWYWCYWINQGTGAAENCTLKVTLPHQMEFTELRDTSGTPITDYTTSVDTISGATTIIVLLGTVEPSNVWNYIVPYGSLPATATPGDTLLLEMRITSSTYDWNSFDNYAQHVMEVTSSRHREDSRDINSTLNATKIADPNGTSNPYPVLANQSLDYTIVFENTADATSPIHSIEIIDSIDFNLDPQTFSVGTMSHPNCSFHSYDAVTGKIKWMCQNIELPPNVNPPEGEGYVKYSISPKPNLPIGTEIDNYAKVKHYSDSLLVGPLVRLYGLCCVPPIRGNVDYDYDDEINIADLVYLVEYSFNPDTLVPWPPASPCPQEANIDGAGGLDIADLVHLVNYMFSQEPPNDPPADCNTSKGTN